MKRLVASLLCVLMLFLAPLKASAEEISNFENAGALYEYWSKNNMPNYITGLLHHLLHQRLDWCSLRQMTTHQ